MKNIKANLLKRFDRRKIEREVETELHFHLEQLTAECLRRGMTLKEAEEEVLKRFGNVERIKNQCVEISKRSSSLMRVLKSFLIAVFLAGVFVRISSADIYGKQVGNMMMIIAASGCLLVYLRGLRFSDVVSKDENSSPLGLNEIGQTSSAANDQFSPLERIIADD